MAELRIQFRMTEEDRDCLKALADANCRSMNGQFLAWIREIKVHQTQKEYVDAKQNQ